MKSPPIQFTDDEARELVEAFIRGDAVPIKSRRRNPGAKPAAVKTA